MRRYTPDLAEDWATVLRCAKNGLFLFERDFVEYHGERFVEMSAIAYSDGVPVAFLPAAIDTRSAQVTSHPGLTFGGVVLRREVRGDVAIEIIEAMLAALREWGATTVTIKLLPQVFAGYPAAELDYVLWRRGFELVRRDLSSILPLQGALPFNSSKNQSVKKASKAGLSVTEAGVGDFHALLEAVLLQQHDVAPVHSKAELEMLSSRFPSQIFVRATYQGDQLLAGALVFNYQHVWHTQYLACSSEGRNLGALDLVVSELKNEATAADVRYLSFGTSSDAAGRVLNDGLLWQKESYGARSLTHDFMHGSL